MKSLVYNLNVQHSNAVPWYSSSSSEWITCAVIMEF
jgi:hypothetical protein